jgi:hypothetical protein
VQDYDLSAELDQRQMSNGVDDKWSEHDRRGENDAPQGATSVHLVKG